MSEPLIPETGQEFPIVRIHPVDWTESVAFVRALRDALSVRTLIINDNFSIDESVLVDSFVTYVANYMIWTHHSHYRRLNLLPNGWTPSKVAVLSREEVPEVFINIARHLSRPRFHKDHGLSLPAISLPVPDGVLYGALAAVAANTVVRNGVPAGNPDAVMAQIQVNGANLNYRHLCFLGIRRNFEGLPLARVNAREGLTPARLTWWDMPLTCFVTALDHTDKFESNVLEADTLLRPISINPAVPPALVAGPQPAAAGPLRDAWRDAFIAHHTALIPANLQWLGGNVLTGDVAQYTYNDFIEWRNTLTHMHPNRTTPFTRSEFISRIRSDIKEFDWPALGVVKEIDDLRVLVNDLGNGPLPLSRRDKRATDRSYDRKQKAVEKHFDRNHEDDQTSGGAANSESSKPSVESLSDRKTESKQQKGYRQRKRRGANPKPAPSGESKR